MVVKSKTNDIFQWSLFFFFQKFCSKKSTWAQYKTWSWSWERPKSLLRLIWRRAVHSGPNNWQLVLKTLKISQSRAFDLVQTLESVEIGSPSLGNTLLLSYISKEAFYTFLLSTSRNQNLVLLTSSYCPQIQPKLLGPSFDQLVPPWARLLVSQMPLNVCSHEMFAKVSKVSSLIKGVNCMSVPMRHL